MSRPTLALSTCWLSHRHTDGYEMLAEMAGLGFEYVELSHGIRITLVEGILKALEAGVIKVASCHNFCPLPPHVMQAAPNLYEPSSSHPGELSQWWKYTLRTLDFATQVGAKKVILHSGSVRFFWFDPETRLEKAKGDRNPAEFSADPSYQKALAKGLDKMTAKAGPWMDRLRDSFTRLIPEAQKRGLQLCVENREGFTELPLDIAMAPFVQSLPEPDTIAYWHDTGHAQVKQEEGVAVHRDLLERNASRQFGFHLHDVSTEGRDHQEIGTGRIDWEMVRSHIKPHHLLVLEMSPRLKTDQVERSRDFVLRMLAKSFS